MRQAMTKQEFMKSWSKVSKYHINNAQTEGTRHYNRAYLLTDDFMRPFRFMLKANEKSPRFKPEKEAEKPSYINALITDDSDAEASDTDE